MSFNFSPLTDEEISTRSLLPEGEYSFEVKSAEEKISKAGNQMIELKLHVFSNDGRTFFMFDYLLSGDNGAYKLKHFLISIGLGDKYNKGSLDAFELIGKCGVCKIKIKEDKSGQYSPKNIVSDYVKKEIENSFAQKKQNDFGDDDFDDIKF